jgi:outer membrane lipoprotein carrier protein
MKKFSAIFFLSFLCFAQTAEEVTMRLEKSLQTTQTLEANFEHIYRSAVVSTPLEEKGKVYFQKPDLMRWEYEDPEHNIYLYKGDKFQWYFVEENQLERGSITDEGQESEILYLLTGKKKLLDYYSVEWNPSPIENHQDAQIKLIPKKEDDESYLLLDIDRKNWLIHKIIFFDWEGNETEFRFSRLKVNVALPKDIFELKLPADVEIIERF